MKLLLSIFILILSSAIGLCQGSKVDSLKKVIDLLESDKVKIDEEIKKLNGQISQILSDQFKNDHGVLPIRSTKADAITLIQMEIRLMWIVLCAINAFPFPGVCKSVDDDDNE